MPLACAQQEKEGQGQPKQKEGGTSLDHFVEPTDDFLFWGDNYHVMTFDP